MQFNIPKNHALKYSINGNVMFYKEKNKLNGKIKTKSCFSFWVARLFLI